ncbi:hypothetical protein [Haloferax sp. DFSO52]|uniref:hypothetical protein n=1 Tax=Haloferax sp. DFSO52 TaxID=3388505 RepID=UPI003A866241
MEYVYATLLLESAGTDLTESSLTAVLEAAGIDADPERLAAVVDTFAVGSAVATVGVETEASR